MALDHQDHGEYTNNVYRDEARGGFELQTQQVNSNPG
jgi:hypothetical protein